jgi:hypothetical protein
VVVDRRVARGKVLGVRTNESVQQWYDKGLRVRRENLAYAARAVGWYTKLSSDVTLGDMLRSGCGRVLPRPSGQGLLCERGLGTRDASNALVDSH